MTKTICIIGATGNQGGSVARRFANDRSYRVRGLTRDPSSPAARELTARGVEMVYADLNQTETLISAFQGASVIFSVTNYWEPFFRPDERATAAEKGISCRRHAYDVEVQQGKNIADAAAAVCDGLAENGFLVSTLSNGTLCSLGVMDELYHFDGKADVFPSYVLDRYPALARKMSCVQTGFFTSSYRLLPELYFKGVILSVLYLCLSANTMQTANGVEMTFPTAPDAAVPHLAVQKDMGNFIYAVAQMPPGKSYMAAGTTCSWAEYIRRWSRTTGIPASYRQISLEETIERVADKEFAREVGDMFLYSTDPGYDGGMDLLTSEDIERAGVSCPMTTLDEFIESEDWSSVMG
ncbi:hypothetical protein ASPZODRAFT_149535 [Penicilliopsis zonata CBS 506.65]|uniref:NmrA-like domain-containing protein n=1 Tax=Penicilliopsis zonata CBS 506.65 TaxID=1073090 RepID=A0A1L9SSF1_9EURO|nr:hypothetical protein ASPZODRAFT_149535 [Penicilliopsis zonata CBS 506.65]OJJ50135.1 hypothetical protein ASPZODRAFT_149535 [Penicilliopsis zonata CBS 506.65]